MGIPAGDREFLRKRRRELLERLAGLRFHSARGPVHGDARVQNLMVDRSGRVILIDFEVFCHDHPEWDLTVTAHEYDRLGWAPDNQYAALSGAHSRDLREWPGFEALCAVQEFRMTTWLTRNAHESPETAAEYGRRTTSLRNTRAPRNRHPR